VAGALAVIRYAEIHGTKHRPWLAALLARRPTGRRQAAWPGKPSRTGRRSRPPIRIRSI
jgi:transposase